MSTGASGTASVLVICKAEDVAKRIESHLRNAGHAARTIWCVQADTYRDLLKREPPDVIFCADDVVELPPTSVLTARTSLAPDVPVILMCVTAPAPASLLAAMNAGVADGVGYGDEPRLKHLEQVYRRELTHRRLSRELRAARADLAEHSARQQRLMAGTADAVAQVQEGILTHINNAFAQMLAHDGPESLASQPLMDLLTPASQAKVKPVLKQFTQDKLVDGTELELEFEKADGKPLKTLARLNNGNFDGEPALEIHIRAESVAARPTSLQTSGRLELFEAMANLPPKTATSLLLIRIDEFQLIEEKLGYRDAEEVMLQFGQLLKERTPKNDKVFRFSSAEFAWLAFGPSPAELQALAEALRRDMTAQVFHARSHEARVTVSIVAQPLPPGSKPTAVVKNGIAEVRALSPQGGNRVKVTGLEPAPTAVTGDAAMATRLKRALDENRFKLAYQSIASLEGDSRQHFDVRVRMVDETGGELQPREFLGSAQKYGLLTRLDQWVVTRALRVLARRAGAPEASTLFVRLSEDSLKTGDEFLVWFRDQLKARPLQAGELGFSLSEDYLRHHVAKSKALTAALRSLKADIVLEQFGSTTQSAALLEQVQAHYVRFDAEFTQSFNDKAHVDRMVALVQLAKQRGVKTICSHVEDANVMARLWQMGINYIQGQNLQEPEVVLLSTDARR